MSEATNVFTCFGGACAVLVDGRGPAGAPQEAVSEACAQLLRWHDQFSRFKPASELASLNRDPRERVPVSATMARFVQAVSDAASLTDGLVDATMLDQIEAAGYEADHLRASLALPLALALAPPRRPAGPQPAGRWREIEVDHDEGVVTRPPGLHFDGGGVVKGLCADMLAERLADHHAYAIDCEGDLRIGGTGGVQREIPVAAPFDGSLLHEPALREGGVATTGITKRSWLHRGRPAHHLLDPATGQPAYTGVVQVTALAGTALEGEALAKAALLSGPERAPGWLRSGGVIVFDDLSHSVIAPSA
ncbi:MAG: FAD:protein FMN transferase [Solirubrobacteraceae bacterium]